MIFTLLRWTWSADGFVCLAYLFVHLSVSVYLLSYVSVFLSILSICRWIETLCLLCVSLFLSGVSDNDWMCEHCLTVWVVCVGVCGVYICFFEICTAVTFPADCGLWATAEQQSLIQSPDLWPTSPTVHTDHFTGRHIGETHQYSYKAIKPDEWLWMPLDHAFKWYILMSNW